MRTLLLFITGLLAGLKLFHVIHISWLLVLAPYLFPLIVRTVLKAIGMKSEDLSFKW
jgi:hypothetical protein